MYYPLSDDVDFKRRRDNAAETVCTFSPHYIFHGAHLSRVRHGTTPPRRFFFLQRWQNNCSLELKSRFVRESGRMDSRPGKAQADSDGWWMLRSHRAHRDWGGYLLQQMGFCTFSTVIHDWKRGTLCVTGYQRFWCGVTQREDKVVTQKKPQQKTDRLVVQGQEFPMCYNAGPKTQYMH